MKKIVQPLRSCIIFRGLSPEEISSLLQLTEYRLKSYKKGEHIAIEGDDCSQLGIVISGHLELQTIYPSGKVSTLTQLSPGGVFGEAILFSKSHEYPITVSAVKISEILFIQKKDVINILSAHPDILENFLSLLSNKLLMLNRKVKVLSLDTIRAKICSFLLKEYKKQKSLTITVGLSRKHMAEHMAIQRPSLSRELIKMSEEGLIEYDRHTITILDLEAVENALM